MSASRTYRHGGTEIEFAVADAPDERRPGLAVTIETPRLHMESVQDNPRAYDLYVPLWQDPVVMRQYATGMPRDPAHTRGRIRNSWAENWRLGNPYSALAVFHQDGSGADDGFVGHIMLEAADPAPGTREPPPGRAELSYVFHSRSWGRGIGTEAASAIVRHYAPATVAEGHRIAGLPLHTIEATASRENAGSWKILNDKLGMTRLGSGRRSAGGVAYRGERDFFEKRVVGLSFDSQPGKPSIPS